MSMAHEDVYKEHYFYELSRRDSLNESLSIPVGLVTLLTGALYVMAGKLSSPLHSWGTVLAVLLCLCATSLVIATYFLIRAYWGYTYKQMPLADELRAYRASLVKYFLDVGKPETEAQVLAAEKFEADLDAEYAKDCRINSLNNESKSAHLFKANAFIVGSIALTIVAAPIFVAMSFGSAGETQRVDITNLKDLAMPNENQQGGDQQQERPAPQPVMPTMPPSRDIKESVEPLREPRERR